MKSGITYVISHNYAKIKVDSYDTLPLEKTTTFHSDIIILIKSVLSEYEKKLPLYYILRKSFV